MAAPASASAAISSASLIIRSGRITADPSTELGLQPLLQRDEEHRGQLIAGGDPAGVARHRVDRAGDRILGLAPRVDRNPEVGDPGRRERRLERRRDDPRLALRGQHEHRQPLHRHRLVARQVPEVGRRAEHDRVDPGLPQRRRARARSGQRSTGRPPPARRASPASARHVRRAAAGTPPRCRPARSRRRPRRSPAVRPEATIPTTAGISAEHVARAVEAAAERLVVDEVERRDAAPRRRAARCRRPPR